MRKICVCAQNPRLIGPPQICNKHERFRGYARIPLLEHRRCRGIGDVTVGQ